MRAMMGGASHRLNVTTCLRKKACTSTPRFRQTDRSIARAAGTKRPLRRAEQRLIRINGRPVEQGRQPPIDDDGEHHVDVYL